jgi:LemA protein
MAHERGTLEAVIAARAQASSALGAVEGGAMGMASMGALANASGALDGALNRLIGLVERYPELKANTNALQLQEELASTENRIAFARQAYNDAVMRLNEGIVVFPASIVANMFGIREMGLFEAAAGERVAVAVKF